MVTLDQAGRGLPWIRVYPPPPAMVDLVEHFWIEDSHGINESHSGGWRIVPDGSAHLIFGVLDTFGTVQYRLRAVGARTVHTDIDRRGRVVTVGARLVPGALPCLIGEDAWHLTDIGAPLLDLSPAACRDAVELLATAGPGRDLVRALADIVAQLRRDDRNRHRTAVTHAVDIIDAARGNADIRRVARAAGFSPRAFRSVFAECVGMSPKRYARVRRLHTAMHLAVHGSKRSLAGVASRSGYADQAHMSRDFRDLLGESPGAYLRRGART